MFYIDPVCRKKLRKKEEYAILKHDGIAYHLCCKMCKDEFTKQPAKYTPPVKEKFEDEDGYL